jgi:hypothetical protein
MTSWMIGQKPFESLLALDPVLTTRFFDSTDAYIFGHVPKNSASNVVAVYPSFADYAKQAVAKAPWVLYTPENWPQTPVIEQRHPKAMMQTFTSLAHARGQRAIIAPARNLMVVPRADCSRQPGETIDAAYLRCQIPAETPADVFICQSQADQMDTAAYAALVAGAKAQLPPETELWAGLTTLRKHPVPAIVAAYQAVQGNASGFWLNTNPATIADTRQLLSMIS